MPVELAAVVMKVRIPFVILRALLIYFAGHGTTAMAPSEWHSLDQRISLIVPHDADRRLESPEMSTYAVPDRTIGALLHHLAEVEGGEGIGNNIVSSGSMGQVCSY